MASPTLLRSWEFMQIRAEDVARDAGRSFDFDNSFSGHFLPLRYSSAGDVESAGKTRQRHLFFDRVHPGKFLHL